MKLLRFSGEGGQAFGVIEGGGLIRPLTGSPFAGIRPGPRTIRLDQVRLLPPVSPGKIIALGLNYRDHIREIGHAAPVEPVIFLKPPSAVIGPGDEIILPAASARVEHEAELALVIGRRARSVSRAGALGHVLGVTCLNDVTARDLQKKDGQWTRAKSYDTFCPLGPWIETEGAAAARTIECLVNGELRQSGSTGDLLFGPADIVAFVSGIMTLEPGDVIATGTPAGVGPLKPGDEVEVRIGGIGSLVNRVS
jgi:2-keto-4-pentenoate hydratase/2-oxohepta-3-ene-1,7-dioic acid hydratase in catechol pathway